MDTILQGIPGVMCYIDDILITGKTDAEHLTNLDEVLQKLHKHGFCEKCKFLADSVEYLGQPQMENYKPFCKPQVLAMCKSYGPSWA